MTAVIYARYSTDSQREESIEGQIRECTAYAEKNGFTVVKHYIDRAVSAKTDNRPQFQQMIKDSERGIFDVIIVWKLDRFARNRYDSARYKTQLKRNGVKLVSATEVISAGPEGIILESVLEGYAEYYSADLSEKVVRGMTENALNSRQFSAFVCVHQPDGFKDLLTRDFCCRRLFVLPGPRCCRGHRRVSHADGHAVFEAQRAKRQQKSRHKTDQPCPRFFWKVMLVGYVNG